MQYPVYQCGIPGFYSEDFHRIFHFEGNEGNSYKPAGNIVLTFMNVFFCAILKTSDC